MDSLSQKVDKIMQLHTILVIFCDVLREDPVPQRTL